MDKPTVEEHIDYLYQQIEFLTKYIEKLEAKQKKTSEENLTQHGYITLKPEIKL